MIQKTESKGTIIQQIDSLMRRIRQKLDKSVLLTSNKKLPKIPQPKTLKGGQLKDYQLQSLAWMVQLAKNNLSGILADDMGLGKTIQAISYLTYIYQTQGLRGKHLIVVPKNVLNNWKRQLEAWAPQFRAIILPGTEVQRMECIQKYIKTSQFDILIATYQSVQTAYSSLKRFVFQTLIVDEAHSIKNQQTNLATCLRCYKFKFTLLLTGTPLSNQLKQLWSLLNFIVPDIFVDSLLFRKIQDSVNTDCQNQQQKIKYQLEIASRFKAIISPFLLRRVKSQINLGLKQKRQFTLFVSLSQLQLKLYRNYLKFNSVYGEDTGYQHSRHVQLRKICAHPYTFSDIQDPKAPPYGEHLIQNCGKLKLLDKLLQKLLKQKHKVLIFSQFTTLLKILQDYMIYRKYKYSTITGQSSLQQRDQNVEEFSKSTDTNIFLISTRAGGIGLNLVAADVVILYDLDWNPQMDKQATDRAYRIGQTKSVKVFKFITNNTIEQRLLQVQKYKLIWDELVIQKGGIARLKAAQQKFQKLDQNKLAGLGAEQIFKLQQNYDDKTIQQIIRMGQQRDKKKTLQIRAKLQKQLKQFGQIHNPFENLQNMKQDLSQIQYQAQKVKALKKTTTTGKLHWKQRQGKNQTKSKYIQPKAYKLYSNTKLAGQLLYKLQNYDESDSQDQDSRQISKSKSSNSSKHLQQKQSKQTKLKQQKMKKQQIIKKLKQLGFYDWTPQQFNLFIQANQKYKKNDYKTIAGYIKTKKHKQVEQYSKQFYIQIQEAGQLRKKYLSVVKKQQKMQKIQKLKQLQQKIIKFPQQIFNMKSKPSNYKTMTSQSLSRMYFNGIKQNGICLQEHQQILGLLNPEAMKKMEKYFGTPPLKIMTYQRVINYCQTKSQEQWNQELKNRYQYLRKIHNKQKQKQVKNMQPIKQQEDQSVKTALKI